MKSGEESEQTEANERQRIIRQINPHFIFNTLATIRIITKINADLAYDMIYDFSKYLRAVFQSLMGPENISFKEEADYIISYTNIQRIRFGNNIMLHFNFEETDFMLPPLSLQPLVENAIIHGLKKGKVKGTVSIRSYKAAGKYIVEVEDDGVGFDVENNLRDGGLNRMKYQFEKISGGKVDIKSAIGEGTLITLHIPGKYKITNDILK